MATAEELLASVIGETEVITVDVESRTIIIPDSIKNLGVASDDDVLRLNFSMPRYYRDVDLSEFPAKRINYLNAKGSGDVYKIEDAVIGDDAITFTWLVGRYAAQYAGSVRFNICFKKFDPDETYIVIEEFNTTPASLPVLTGLETSEAVIQKNEDLIVKWENEIFGIGNTLEQDLRNTAAELATNLRNTSATQQTVIELRATEIIERIDEVVDLSMQDWLDTHSVTDEYLNSAISTYHNANKDITDEEIDTLTAALQ